jgi:hypothetical protein
MKVRVKSHWPPGHIRTPAYLRGKIGHIERRIGLFNNPEDSAYRQDGRSVSWSAFAFIWQTYGARVPSAVRM